MTGEDRPLYGRPLPHASVITMRYEKPPYVAPFIRRLMPTASEPEILEASENLRDFLNALYDMFLEQEAQRKPTDSLDKKGHGRFDHKGDVSPQS